MNYRTGRRCWSVHNTCNDGGAVGSAVAAVEPLVRQGAANQLHVDPLPDVRDNALHSVPEHLGQQQQVGGAMVRNRGAEGSQPPRLLLGICRHCVGMSLWSSGRTGKGAGDGGNLAALLLKLLVLRGSTLDALPEFIGLRGGSVGVQHVLALHSRRDHNTISATSRSGCPAWGSEAWRGGNGLSTTRRHRKASAGPQGRGWGPGSTRCR